MVPAVRGHVEPRVSCFPTVRQSAGDDAIRLAAKAGLFLDEWQQLVLRRSLGETPAGLWQTPDVAVLCARQNGKNAILEARLLAGLFLFEEQLIIHTAHEMKAAAVTFRRIKSLVKSTPSLNRRVANISNSKGDEGIELHNGNRLRFMARTGGSGRSFSADTLILDEAYNLPDHVMNALTPTLAGRPNPQVWYTSSAVNQVEHPHGLTLARVRRRALAGGDAELAYAEWSADDGLWASLSAAERRVYASDPQVWAVANPGFPNRVTYRFLETQLKRLGPAGFAAEHLSIGDWPDEPSDDLVTVVDRATWDELVDRFSVPEDPVAFAVVAAEKGASAAVCAAGYRSDGLVHVEVLASQRGVSWVVEYVAERVRRNRPCATMVDPASPAGPLIPLLENAGVEVTKVSATGYRQACEGWYTAVTERDETVGRPVGGLRHQDDPRLNEALFNAVTRPLGQGWVFDQRNSTVDLSPLIAVVLAMQGLVEHGHGGTVNLW